MNGIIPGILAGLNGQQYATNTISYELEKNRLIYLVGEIDDFLSTSIVSQLHYLDLKSHDDITILINSPGGSVSAGFAIYDTIKYGIKSKVITVAVGEAASMGAFILAAGEPGKRFASPSTDIMIHQPLGGVKGQATDIMVEAEHIQKKKHEISAILAIECGKRQQDVLLDTERNNWMTSEEAKEYGLIDFVGFPD